MQAFTVYLIDYVKQEKTPIGLVVERRKKNRPDNLLGLLKMARKSFAVSPQEAFQIVLERNVLRGAEGNS